MSAHMGGLMDFVDELVKLHMKQADPQATEDIEHVKKWGTSEVVFFFCALALGCYCVVDLAYPYVFPKKKAHAKPKSGGRARK